MTLYYQDESVTLYHGDSLEILPTLEIKANVLLTDPPYFKVKQEEWDNQWNKAHEFLSWMGDFLDRAKPLLTDNASVWVFASPAMTTSVERLVGERFRVLNSVRWAKPSSQLRRYSLPEMRSFLSIWEGIVFAEQFSDAYDVASKALRREVFKPLGDYIRTEVERSGWDANSLEVAMGYVRTKNPSRGTEIVRRWCEGSSLPSEEAYMRMRATLNASGGGYLARAHGDLIEQNARLLGLFEEARGGIDHLRRPFSVTSRTLSEDIWHFPSVPGYPGKHSCEKPLPLLRHMIEASSRPGDLILDAFAGSGSTLDAARQTGRRAIGIEKDERWCENIARRLTQDELDIFGGAA
jgi:site-specific DNA-methyltransferase (adenine-specific)